MSRRELELELWWVCGVGVACVGGRGCRCIVVWQTRCRAGAGAGHGHGKGSEGSEGRQALDSGQWTVDRTEQAGQVGFGWILFPSLASPNPSHTV